MSTKAVSILDRLGSWRARAASLSLAALAFYFVGVFLKPIFAIQDQTGATTEVSIWRQVPLFFEKGDARSLFLMWVLLLFSIIGPAAKIILNFLDAVGLVHLPRPEHRAMRRLVLILGKFGLIEVFAGGVVVGSYYLSGGIEVFWAEGFPPFVLCVVLSFIASLNLPSDDDRSARARPTASLAGGAVGHYPIIAALPVVALLYAGPAIVESVFESETIVEVKWHDVSGLIAGSDVQFGGAKVGRVRAVSCAQDLGSINVRIALARSEFAQTNAGYWLSEMEVAVRGITSLSIAGGRRHVVVGFNPEVEKPERCSSFVGLNESPWYARFQRGDKWYFIKAQEPRGFSLNSPVLVNGCMGGQCVELRPALGEPGVVGRVIVWGERDGTGLNYASMVKTTHEWWDQDGRSTSWMSPLTNFEPRLAFTGALHFAPGVKSGESAPSGHTFTLGKEPKDWQSRAP